MHTIRWMVVGMLVIAVSLAGASAVPALTVTGAKVARGVIQVRGKQAAPDATITWEGEAVTQASSNGRFRFDTAKLPGDCVGEVGDTVQTVEAVVQLCGPAGVPGPKGDQGDPGLPGIEGPPGPGLTVVDSNGAFVGAVVKHFFPDNPRMLRVVRSVAGRPLAFLVDDAGFVVQESIHSLFYVSGDCSGPPLFPTSSGEVGAIPEAPTVPKVFINAGDGLGYYQVGDLFQRDLNSWGAVAPTDPRGVSAEACAQAGGGPFIPPNVCCYPNPTFQSSGAEVETVDPSTFGLAPPFHVEGP